MTADPDNEGFATPEEAQEAIEGLSDDAVARLMVAAKFFWKRRVKGVRDGWESPEELLNEAVVRTLEGARRWRRSAVPIVKHLDRTMESISSHIAAKRRSGDLGLPPRPVESLGLVDQVEFDQNASRIEELVAAREEARVIETLLGRDSEALELLRHRRDGCSASETQAELGMTKQGYEAAWKRIRRTFAEYTKDNEEA